MNRIKNMTPHELAFIKEDGSILRLPPEKTPARVTVDTVIVGDIDGIPVTRSAFGEIENLPEKEEGTILIVSSIVAQRARDRDDVFVPNQSVRDDSGKIVGCRSLAKI